ncbi:MAG: hypothetical protein ACPHWZ_03045, partial [Longimicrobiales bacterium]
MSTHLVTSVRAMLNARAHLLFLLGISLALGACAVPDAPAQDEASPEPWNWSEEFVRSAVDQVR